MRQPVEHPPICASISVPNAYCARVRLSRLTVGRHDQRGRKKQTMVPPPAEGNGERTLVSPMWTAVLCGIADFALSSNTASGNNGPTSGAWCPMGMLIVLHRVYHYSDTGH